MALTVADINAIGDICIILSSFYILLKCRKISPRMAYSFGMICLVSVLSSVANFLRLTGDANFAFYMPLTALFIVFLSYGISQIVEKARFLFVSFLLYLLVLPGVFLGFGMDDIYAATGLAGRLIGTMFFTVLVLHKNPEIRTAAMLGVVGMFLGGLFIIFAVSEPSAAQHFYIAKIFIALAFLMLAHVSNCFPHHIRGGKRRR